MKGNFVTRTISILGLLLVTLYFGVRFFQYFMDPLTTTAAYRFQSEESFLVTGYLIRQETVLPSVDSTMVYLPREEGERVSKGGQVATLYHNAQALEAAMEMEDLTLQLERLEYAASLFSGAQAVRRLDENILSGIYDLRRQMVLGDLTDACLQAASLRTLSIRRDYAYSATGSADLAGQVDGLRQRLNALAATANSGRTFVTAKETGWYSALVDGYETTLTPESLEELTPSALASAAPESGLSSNVGKLITGETWYFAANLPSAEAETLRAGDRVSVRFANGLERNMEMRVRSISGEEDGQRTLVLESREYLALTTLLRHQTAQVIRRTYEGIRVPKNAVRVETRTVGDGEEAQEVSFTGVYCRMARLASLKPVRVLYEGEDYYLVAPDEEILDQFYSSVRVSRTLRGGDEVIITARDLYDGKVVS